MFICLYIDFWWASSKIQQHYVRLHPVAEEQKDKKGKGCCFYILGRTALGGVVWGWGTFEYPWRSEMGKKNMKNITWIIILTLMSPLLITKQVREVDFSYSTGIKILNFTDIPRNETWQITINNSPISHRQGHSCRYFSDILCHPRQDTFPEGRIAICPRYVCQSLRNLPGWTHGEIFCGQPRRAGLWTAFLLYLAPGAPERTDLPSFFFGVYRAWKRLTWL